MFAKLIATIAGAAMLIGVAGARPAQAGDDDVARALAVIAGLAILGKVIKDRNDDQAVTRHGQINTFNDRLAPRPLPQKAKRKLLPGNCLRSFETRRGTVRMFGRKCLNNSYRHVNSLPQHCAVRVRTNQGPRAGYEARCLRHQGYQLARR